MYGGFDFANFYNQDQQKWIQNGITNGIEVQIYQANAADLTKSLNLFKEKLFSIPGANNLSEIRIALTITPNGKPLGSIYLTKQA